MVSIKVDGQYLDFDDFVTMERRVLLFEEAAEPVGDFSYQFSLYPSVKNVSIFNLYSLNIPGVEKFRSIPATIENNGQLLYSGFIKVERKTKKEIQCSFFSGNSNWIEILNFNIRDFDFSEYDKDFTKTEISNRSSATTGLIFPVINTGVMDTRSYVNWHVDDFQPFVYCKSIIQTLLNRNGIKLEGDILQDWRYNHLITTNNSEGTPQIEINNRKTNVGKTTDQSSIGTTPVKVTFHLESGDVYYPGDLWDTALDRYTADYKMVVDISTDVIVDAGTEAMHIYIYKNGVQDLDIYADTSVSTGKITTYNYKMEAGDYIEMFAALEAGSGGQIFSFYLTITPVKIYRVFTRFLLPRMNAGEFISSVFQLFNPVVDFNAITKTITVNLFKNVIRRPELDISQYINPENIEEDYDEIMQNYGRINRIKYSGSDDGIIETYNNNNDLPYAAGNIDTLNSMDGRDTDLFESIFIPAGEDIKNPFTTFLPHFDWRTLEETSLRDESVSITNSSGPLFTSSGFAVGDLVRISNSTQSGYNGDRIVSTATSTTFKVAGLQYLGNATADVVKMEIKVNKKNDQALLLALPSTSLSDFTTVTLMFYADAVSVSGESPVATAYFFKPLQDLPVDDLKESLSFGPIEIKNAHQITMMDSYWRDFSAILLDPLKLITESKFPKSVFERLFDGPVRIKTGEFNARFFVSKTIGYEGKSDQAITTEIVKLNSS